jgi:hypothetical protein
VFISDRYGVVIERCDPCFYNLPVVDKLSDYEAEALPEAQAKRDAVIKEMKKEAAKYEAVAMGGEA